MTEHSGRVLVVDDEPAIRRFLRTALTANGYSVAEAASGLAANSVAISERPDIVLLDLGLPDMDGIDVTRLFRTWTRAPIIVISVRGQEADKVAALDAGADDYLTKPFGMEELLARMRVAMRHAASDAGEPVFVSGELVVDHALHEVRLNGRDVQLTPTEFELLRALTRYPGRVLTHRQLLREVWGPGCDSEAHMLRVNISNLRRKVEPDPAKPRYIRTEPGVGYRFRSDP